MVVQVRLIDGVPCVHLANNVGGALQAGHQRLDFGQFFRVVQPCHMNFDQFPAAWKVSVLGFEPLPQVGRLWQEPDRLEPGVEKKHTPSAVAKSGKGGKSDEDLADLEG